MAKTKRKWIILDWLKDGCLRAIDIPFSATQNIKERIEAIIFGNGYKQDSKDAEASTTSTTLQRRIRMSSGTLPPGVYRIGWYYECQHRDVRSRCIVKGYINNSITMFHIEIEPKDKNNWYSGGGFYNYTVTADTSFNINLYWGSSKNGKEAKIRRVRLEIWRTQ